MHRPVPTTLAALALALASLAGAAHAQDAPPGPQIILPVVPPRHWPMPRPEPVELAVVDVQVRIDDQVATTRFEFTLRNPSGRAQEAQLLLPVPEGVAVRSLQYDGTGPEPRAEVLPRDEARRIYESIVRASKDPALVEFVGTNLLRTSAFPVPPGASQKLRLTFEQVLPRDGNRVDYSLPRSEALAGEGAAWRVAAELKSATPIATVYSSSHDITNERLGPGHVSVRVQGMESSRGSLRLSYVTQDSARHEIVSSAMLCPAPELGPDAGYFLLLLSPPSAMVEDRITPKREVVMILDRSGSMRGEKIEQAKAAAVQVVRGLGEGEMFNLIDYSDSVSSFAPAPVAKTPETAAKAEAYIARLQADGGTNIHDALLEGLRRPVEGANLGLLLFVTDGLATVGERSEVKIREAAAAANTARRRIFSFGVGFDVNTPLLVNLAQGSRGSPTFVLPKEDVEVKVSQVFRRLAGPVMTFPVLRAPDGALRDLQPAALPDIFAGDQVVVLGEYRGSSPIRVTIAGQYFGKDASFEVKLDPREASLRHSFIPRLWANRKVVALVDQVRQMAAEGISQDDPRVKELVDTIVRLSTRHGILTEYTAFLSREETDFRAGLPAAATPAREALVRRSVTGRTGSAGVSQQADISGKMQALNTQAANSYAYVDKDGESKQARFDSVNNVADQTFFRRQNRWVDGRLLEKESEAPDETIEFASDAYFRLVSTLTAEGRQSILSQGGDVLTLVGTKRVLVKAP